MVRVRFAAIAFATLTGVSSLAAQSAATQAGAPSQSLTDLLLKQSGTAIHLDRVYETDMAEGLKVMALEGHGVAFLPHSAVKKELRSRRLVSAAPSGMKDLEMTMEVRAYREKPLGKEAPKGTAQSLWAYLAARTGPK